MTLGYFRLDARTKALRRTFGTGFSENDSIEVAVQLKKWVLFHALSQSLKVTFKEEISEYLLEEWSTPPGYKEG